MFKLYLLTIFLTVGIIALPNGEISTVNEFQEIMTRMGLYPGAPKPPSSIGGEASGIITKIGKSNTVNYEVINNTGKDILITSTYNVTPQKAGLYFNKLDCFCYEERKVLAGQKIVLPVTFFISPEIIDDPNTSELKSLTLSYTFFNVNNINVSNLY